MATNKTNRITLKIAVAFDNVTAKKEAQRLQNEFNKQFDKNAKERKKKTDELTDAQNKNNDSTKKSIKATKTLGQEFKGLFKKAAQGFVVVQVLLAITTQIRRAITLAFELDKAFTNFAIVSKATASEIAQVDTEVGNLTKRLGALKAEVVNTVTEFARAGFTIQESLQLAETAIIGANVGMTSLADVTTFLVAGLKAFRLEAEESTRILDVLFRVANTSAIDLEGIGQAFLRSANTLRTAGASLEQSAALIAAANESIQDPAKIGSALNTIASRLRGVGVEGEAIPKLAESFRQVGIEIQNADGSFRDIFSIFEEFANIYEDLDEITRESLLEKLAGKRQKNVLIGLLTNFDTAKQAVIDAENSAGEAAEAQEKFLKSLEGQAKLLKDAWNSLLEALKDSGALEVVIKALTAISKGLAFIVKEIPLVIAGISGLTLQFVAFGVKAGTAIGFATGGLSILIGLLAVAAQGFIVYNKVTETSAEKIQSLNTELSTLKSNLAELESLEKPTKAQQDRIDLIKERIDLTNELLEREQELVAIERRSDLGKLGERANNSNVLTGSPVGLNKTLDDLQRAKLEILEINESLSMNSEAYKINAAQIEVLDKWINNVSDTLENKWGIVLSRSERKTDDLTESLSKLEKQQEATNRLFQESKGALTLSEDIDKLEEALSELEETGSISDNVLNDLLVTFPDLIQQTGLTEESFKTYVESVKSGSSEVIEAKKALAKANIETALQEIEILKALAQANTQYSSAFLFDDFKAQQKLITDNENLIGLLNNEIGQINAPRDKDRDKQTKVLTALEQALNKVNFQIELQQKLLARTDIPNEQIKINQELISLYNQQRDVLVQQQQELESQRGTIEKGTEAYDDFIEKGYDLSLAIEDSTNNIYALEQANRQLNKTIKETNLGDLESTIKSLSDSIKDTLDDEIESIRELAKLEADRFEKLINSKKDELSALKEANEERENQVKLEQLLQNLQDLRERRANILANKNTRIVKDADVGFEFISDRAELEDVNNQIIDAEQAIADFRREQVLNEEVRKLELTIEGLENQAKAEQESYDERVELLESFKEETDGIVESGAEIQRAIVANLANTLENIERGSYTSRLEGLNSFISQYNAKLSQLNQSKSQIQAIENSIKQSQLNIQALQSNPTISATAPVGSSSSNTASSGSLANKIVGGNTSNSTSNTTVGNINLKTDATSIDKIIKDARRQTPLLSKN